MWLNHQAVLASPVLSQRPSDVDRRLNGAGRKLGIAPQELLQALQQLTDEMAKAPSFGGLVMDPQWLVKGRFPRNDQWEISLVGGLVAIFGIFPLILGCCHHPN